MLPRKAANVLKTSSLPQRSDRRTQTRSSDNHAHSSDELVPTKARTRASDELLSVCVSSLDFASLTPANRRTARGIHMMLEDINGQRNEIEHPEKFV